MTTEDGLLTNMRFGALDKMAYLINRNPSGRILCLHGVLQYLHHHWGDGPYEISNIKFDSQRSPNIHHFSVCRSDEFGFESCRYLTNPASLAGCALVNSLQEDLQKSKSASDVFNALDGLGFIERRGNTGLLTELGKAFIQAELKSERWERVLREAISGYGPFVGFMRHVEKFQSSELWRRSSIPFGFVDTGEEVSFEGTIVRLSTGSQGDTITRTRSILTTWGVAAGYFCPKNFAKNVNMHTPSQVKYWDYLMAPRWPDGFLNAEILADLDLVFVSRPLSYNNLTKSTKSLREVGQGSQRRASLLFEEKVRARRFAIAYALSESCKRQKSIDSSELIALMTELDIFVVDSSQANETLRQEFQNAFVIGTPFEQVDGTRIRGLSEVDYDVLSEGAPEQVVEAVASVLSSLDFA
jgi:hypothetical protein